MLDPELFDRAERAWHFQKHPVGIAQSFQFGFEELSDQHVVIAEHTVSLLGLAAVSPRELYKRQSYHGVIQGLGPGVVLCWDIPMLNIHEKALECGCTRSDDPPSLLHLAGMMEKVEGPGKEHYRVRFFDDPDGRYRSSLVTPEFRDDRAAALRAQGYPMLLAYGHNDPIIGLSGITVPCWTELQRLLWKYLG